MADRFSGSVSVFGPITKQQYTDIEKLVMGTGADASFDEGFGYFFDCVDEDFKEFRKYCQTRNIPYQITWDAKYEYDAAVNIYVDGVEREYDGNNKGEIMVSLKALRSNNDLTVQQYLDGLAAPDLPRFELIDDEVNESVTEIQVDW